MMKDNLKRPQMEGWSPNRVSRAVWPANLRHVVATGKAAQRRRDWLMQRRWLVLLVDALSLRVIFVLTTLLVVVSSLLVALLGLAFWYLLLVPLLLFALLAFLPFFLATKPPVEVPSPFAQDFKSSTGFLPFPSRELRSSTGLFTLSSRELQSRPGYSRELQSAPGYMSEAHTTSLLAAQNDSPATPMPGEPPLVRVLETYDLRQAPVKHFFEDILRSEPGEHTFLSHPLDKNFWNSTACPSTLNARTSALEERASSASSSEDQPDQE